MWKQKVENPLMSQQMDQLYISTVIKAATSVKVHLQEEETTLALPSRVRGFIQ
jgi:hypothetical protein